MAFNRRLTAIVSTGARAVSAAVKPGSAVLAHNSTPPRFRMVTATSRRYSSARLYLLLGALVLFALLLTMQPPPAQASSHITKHQGCSGTSAASPRVVSPGTENFQAVASCFTNHGSGSIRGSGQITAVTGRSGPRHNYILTKDPERVQNPQRTKITLKSAAQLSELTPWLGTAASTPGDYTFDFTLTIFALNDDGSEAFVDVFYRITYRLTLDYDTDDDGLIEISNAAQLNAIRHNVDGSGVVDDMTNQAAYEAAFPGTIGGAGCPATGCTGYEIGANSSGGAVNIDLNVAPHNADMGWDPIDNFAAVFEGNGNTISGLFINRTFIHNGLFGSVESEGKVRNVGLTGVNVTGGLRTGALVGINVGAISGSYAEGSITAAAAGSRLGGLVGGNASGTITASYAEVSVSGGDSAAQLGGLVGESSGTGAAVTASYATGAVSGGANSEHIGGLAGRNVGTVRASYATGAISGNGRVGGLVGSSSSTSVITASYSTGRVTGTTNTGGLVGLTTGTVTNSYWDTTTSGQASSAGGTGKTTSDLQTPTAYGTSPSIYAAWNLNLDGMAGDDDPWDFGTTTDYPRLKYDGLEPSTQHPVDYDSDDDGLIEISNAAQLNAIRWDPDGDGGVDTANQTTYDDAFPGKTADMGCPTNTQDDNNNDCLGYEIGANSSAADVNIGLNVAPHNTGMGWEPITGFAATFDGNHNTISGLFINRTTNDNGLFGTVTAAGTIRNVGLTGVNVTGGNNTGGLVGHHGGSITASYSGGSVSGASAVGGLVGRKQGAGSITASYSGGAVSGASAVGGLVGNDIGSTTASYSTSAVSGNGNNIGGLAGGCTSTIKASYSTGVVTAATGSTKIGGLCGNAQGIATDSYWDTETSGRATSGLGTGKTTSELQTPTAYGTSPSIYANWNLNLDGMAGDDDPWDFGTTTDYPRLKYGGLDVLRQHKTDYDGDKDGLIEIATAAQLNAIRWDVDGDGMVDAANQSAYDLAFPDPVAGMGCPAAGCAGYEIGANSSGAAVNINLNVAPHNADMGWTPIPGFAAIFDGNGNTISGLFINRTTASNGLFGTVTAAGKIRNVGLTGVNVTGGDDTGALVGSNVGAISGSYASGVVTTTGSNSGGLVGENNGGTITASHAAVIVSGGADSDGVGGLVGTNIATSSIIASFASGAVSSGASSEWVGGLAGINYGAITASYSKGSVSGGEEVGGLAGYHDGTITASYSYGAVSGSSSVGGLVGLDPGDGTETNSYWDTTTSGQASSAGGTGKTTGELQMPTAYGGIYANWNLDLDGDSTNDDPWDFGAATNYPRLKFGGLNPLTQHVTDYDSDDDGLIEITNVAQLNVIRHDVDGNGMVATANQTAYNAAFPDPFPGMGCEPVSDTPTCTGYEIGARPSSFALNIDLNVAPHNADKGWAPIADFATVFDGNGNTISGLFINDTATDNTADKNGLFGTVTATGKIHNVGLTGVSVTGRTQTGALVGSNSGEISGSYAEGSVTATGNHTGGLAGENDGGAITASYAAVSVSGGASSQRLGGLVGTNSGTIKASYSSGSVGGSTRVGGLVGFNDTGSTVVASYSTGVVVSVGVLKGGLVGSGNPGATVTDSYWDRETSGLTNSAGGTGHTTGALQAPTAYTGIYANWNLDLDGDSSNDDPWNFGTATQYPRLKFGGLNPLTQHRMDYDSDDDGLIEITNATQLNVIRHDVDGNGMVATANQNAYDLAFPDPFPGMGCKPVSDTPTCTGYEIGAGPTTTAVNIDLDVAPYDTGTGWTPIGSFAAIFEGNGNTISGLFINRTTNDNGLFGTVTAAGKIRSVGLTGVNVSGGTRNGALAGKNSGAISGSHAQGSVTATTTTAGGLVGENAAGAITASYAEVSVDGGVGSSQLGGLVGLLSGGAITASYATGTVSGDALAGNVGGLAGRNSGGAITASYSTGLVSGTGASIGGLVGSVSAGGTVTNSYWDTTTSSRTSSAGGTGKTTSELKTPTAYTGIYADWDLNVDGRPGDDDPWDFGGSADYPALDYGSLSPWASQWKLLLTATPGGRRVTLNWNPGAYGDRPAAITQWQYRQKEGANAYGAWQAVPNSGPNTAQHVVTPLTGGTLYTFQVRAANTGGEAVGPESAEVSATPSTLGPPGQPTGLTATPDNRQVTLTWDAGIDDGGAAITLWDFRYSTDGTLDGSPASVEVWTTISGSGPATTTTRVTGLVNGTAHLFQVRAHNSEGSRAASAEVSATPRVLSAPAAPTGLTAAPGPGKATLTWAAGTDNGGVAIDRWEYRQRAGSGNYGSWVQISTDPATVQHEVGSLTPGTLYTFLVRAHNARGDGQSATTSATPTVVPPAQPTGLTATAGAGQVTLMWASGTNSGSAPIDRWQYRQKVGTDAYGSWTQISTDPGAVQHVVTSLLANTLHTFQVRAHNSEGAGPASAEASATPTLGPPAQPTGLTVTPGNTRVVLRWNPGTSHGGAAINLWQYRQKAGSGAYGSWTQISTTPTTTQHEVSGLTNGVLYTFQVRAGNTGGGNGPGAEATATPNLTDYDSDDDGLIEIWSAAQLNAIRWDLDGDGVVAAADQASYRAAFLDPMPGMGCSAAGCAGYEIGTGSEAAALDIDLDVHPFNTGAGWAPIGHYQTEFWTTFEGNGNTISGLFIDRPCTRQVGLFGILKFRGQIRNVGLTGVNVTGGASTGALVGFNYKDILRSYAVGAVSGGAGSDFFGGLVGSNNGTITASYADVTVTVGPSSRGIGGLVGQMGWGHMITASYAVGAVSSGEGSEDVGGLVGFAGDGATITASYWDRETSGQTSSAGGRGRTTRQLQSPTGYTGIYAGWNLDLDGVSGKDDPWDFGTSSDYPALRFGVRLPRSAAQSYGPASVARGYVQASAAARERPTGPPQQAVGLTETAGGCGHSNHPPVFGSETYTFTVSDGATAGDVVGSVAATDSDAGDELWYTITAGNEAGKFAIVSTDGQVTVAGALDHATAASYTLTVEAGDGNGGRATATATVVIAASTPPGQPGNLAASEAEADGAVTLTWDAPADGGAPSGYMILRRAPGLGQRDLRTLTDDTGSAATTHTDTSVQPGVKYIYRVKAHNAAGQGAPSRPAQITTAAAANNPPVFGSETHAFTVSESATAGDVVGSVAATDSDAGDELSYTITAGNEAGKFAMGSADGQVTVAGVLDYETAASYTLTVQAGDGNGGRATASVVVTVTKANESPTFDTASYDFTIPEDAATGDSVGAVSASDPDEGQSVAYSITAGNDAGRFSINAETGEISVASVLDYETASSHTLTVQASDGNGGRDTATVTITVTNVNEAPVFNPGSYDFSIAESANTWTSIGRLTATDQDDGDTITYSITSGNADDRFMIDWTYGDILLTKELDYETTPSYTLTVEARDGNGGTATASVGITVTKANGSPTANESPTFDTAGYAFTIPEDAATGDSVGAVSASDPDEGQSVAYSISAGNDAGRFSINAGTGEISVASALDHETASSHTLTVLASDGNGGTDTATVVVTVTKVNSPPEFGSGTYAFPVSESATAGDVVGSVAATDSDAGDELSYTITAGNEAGKFAIGSADGQVTVAGVLDYETAASYTLTVQAGDGNGGTATASVVITVTKANESPTFDTASYDFTIPEDAATGDSVGAVSASDPDEGQSVAYSISAGNDAGKLSINAETGEISVASVLDYETASSHTLTVLASDGNGGTATATVVITVTKVNSPPEFGSGTYAFTVSDGATAGDRVGSVAATDSDAGDELSYTITAGNEAGKFAIGSADGQVTIAGVLDYETAANYTLTVQAGDGNGGRATASVVVTVTKANESPTFDTASYDFTIPEDAATGGSVGTISASDPDEGQSVAYSISAGNDAGKFSINAGTGEVAVASALDYETASSYTLTVTASDGNGGTDTATVTITVTDVNEAPVFNPGSYDFSIAESANTWTSIGRLTATDQDAGDTITYYITSGNADDRFAIDWTYGDILLMKELDYETTPSYTLTVEARDGNGGTDSAVVTITVVDVAE